MSPAYALSMRSTHTTAIDIAEAAYDLQIGAKEWLPNLLERGAPMFDQGLGCAGAIWAGQSTEGEPLIAQLCSGPHHPDLGLRFARAARAAGTRVRGRASSERAAGVRTASESNLSQPAVLRALQKHVGCKDVLGMWALDPDLRGVGINMPTAKRLTLSRSARARWQKLAIHIAAAHRLRCRLGFGDELPGAPLSEIPLQADALIDPKRFAISDAKGHAQDKEVSGVLREAARKVDEARTRVGRRNADQALDVWQGLVRGKWSLIDWFDTDGRRFVLVVPNAPNCGDPRGLTERELQVATFSARGESAKLVGYRLGVSRQRVSQLLRSAMRKLCVKTQAQLVLKLRIFQPRSNDAA